MARKISRLKIAIISAALPPRLDGIGDYTALLAAHLARSAEVQILTAEGTRCDPVPGVDIVPTFRIGQPQSFERILAVVRESKPDWVLLQYNPFSFGKWGLNLTLPRVMRQIKKTCPGTRVAMMAHETFVPVINWKFAIMTLWQRRQFRQLGRSADALFFSIEAWTRDFARWFPGKTLVHLPVGSNIPHVPMSRTEARARLGIADDTLVLGLFGGMHISRLIEWSRDAAQAVAAMGQPLLVLHAGPDADAVQHLFSGLPVRAEGPLPAEEISRRFAAMDLFLSPFSDGISTRRGSLMTGLQHGIAAVGTRGHHTDSLLAREDGKALLLAGTDDPAAFIAQVLALAGSRDRRTTLGCAGQALFKHEFSWEQIAARLLSHLGSENPASKETL